MHKSQVQTLGRAVLETTAPLPSLRLLFWGFGKGRPARMPALRFWHAESSSPPSPPPTDLKGRLWWGIGRIEEADAPFRRGICCPFFSFCVFCDWFGVLCLFFAVLLFLGSLFEKFSGANFCFWCRCWSCVFLVLFCLCFCFMFCWLAPENVWKSSLDVRSFFCGFVLSLLLFFLSTSSCFSRFLFFKRESSGSNRTPLHALVCFVFFLSLSPPHRDYVPFWPCVLFFSHFVGVPFWAPGVLAIFRILSVFWGGLRLLAPLLRPCFLDGEAARVLVVDSPFVVRCFFPFTVVCATLFLEGPSRRSRRRGQKIGWSRPPLGRVIPTLLARRVGPLLFWDFDGFFGQPEGRRDPRGLFIWGGGALSAPSGPFSHARFCFSLPQVSF